MPVPERLAACSSSFLGLCFIRLFPPTRRFINNSCADQISFVSTNPLGVILDKDYVGMSTPSRTVSSLPFPFPLPLLHDCRRLASDRVLCSLPFLHRSSFILLSLEGSIPFLCHNSRGLGQTVDCAFHTPAISILPSRLLALTIVKTEGIIDAFLSP